VGGVVLDPVNAGILKASIATFIVGVILVFASVWLRRRYFPSGQRLSTLAKLLVAALVILWFVLPLLLIYQHR
jgi:hypothetical protein